MLTRILSGAVGLILFIAVIAAPPVVLKVALIIISAIGIYEIYKAFSIVKYIPLLVLAIFLPLMCSFDFTKWLPLYVLIFILVAVATMLKCHESFSSEKLAASVFYPLIISAAFSLIGTMRGWENGIWKMCLPFAMAWSTDTFAYFTGRFLGKHKLCEKLSPKKTVEGAFGGVAGAIIVILIYTYFCPSETNYIFAILFAIAVSVVSQMGDIFFSCIKRENGIKDFGNLMPGHGGVMDRFDSVILTAPLTYLFITLTNFI